jgi:hypothetical protein
MLRQAWTAAHSEALRLAGDGKTRTRRARRTRDDKEEPAMVTDHAEITIPQDFEEFAVAEYSLSGTADDDDDRDDEHAGENEAPVGVVDEETEAPEEFEHDDEGVPERPARGDADGNDR